MFYCNLLTLEEQQQQHQTMSSAQQRERQRRRERQRLQERQERQQPYYTSTRPSSPGSLLFMLCLLVLFCFLVLLVPNLPHKHHPHSGAQPQQSQQIEFSQQTIKNDDDGEDSTSLSKWLVENSAFDLHLYQQSIIAGKGILAQDRASDLLPCQPHKIHLSPTTDVVDSTSTQNGAMNMTLSFALDHTKCDLSSNELSILILYGRSIYPENTIVLQKDDLIQMNKQFDYHSSKTGEYYTSDNIYHVVLSNLQGGQHQYWYRIQVFQSNDANTQQQQQQQQQSHDDNSFLKYIPSPVAASMIGPLIKPPQQLSTEYYHLRGASSSHKTVGITPTYHFTTPPLYGQPTSLALVGDLGQTSNSTKTMNRILQKATQQQRGGLFSSWLFGSSSSSSDDAPPPPPVSALVIAGDLSYADGEPRRWDSWLEIMEPLLRSLPFVSVPGNHEIECDNTTTHDTFKPYEHWFRNPNRLDDPHTVSPTPEYIDTLWQHSCLGPSQFLGTYDYGNAFYQYQHGLVHIIALNSYTSILPRSTQYNWLTQQALPSVDRSKTPWLMVVFHCPLYSTFLGHNQELNSQLMKSSIQDILKEYKVNIVISGHDHAYLRTHPVHHDIVDPTGSSPMYWTLGAGGNREGHTRGYIHDEPEPWVAVRNNDEFGFGHFFAPNATHAHLQWIRDDENDVDANADGEVVRDSVWIENYYYDF